MSEQTAVPRHVGIIMDGNRRWAIQRGLSPQDGHRKGFETFKKIADASLERGISFLSVFAFSTENWSRAKEEVSFLLNFVQIVLKKYINELSKKNIRFIWLGSEEGLDRKIIKQLRDAEIASRQNTAGTFCLCFNYGGQQEIADAAVALVNAKKSITPDSITSQLYGGKDVPPIDLLIRTSGEKRISNFMLWRAAYSELYFSDKLWPDFAPADLDAALVEYNARQRRFGL